ncbi:MAG TPA: ribose-phosphate diphosphokinase [Anaerolineae bacterium]|nr:ribose-phosphate diphosphokinase [Anaerolineae bacterium]
MEAGVLPERIQFGELVLMAGNANPALANKIAAELGQPLENTLVSRFDDGEIRVDLDAVVRGTDVFIIQPICQSHDHRLAHPCSLLPLAEGGDDTTCPYQSVNDNLMELLVMIDATRRASAGRITAVVPYMAYAKQEKKKRGHEPITAKLVANLITVAGADRFLVIDLHTPAIEGFFDIPVDHMRMAFLMASHYRARLAQEEAVVVSPDAGGVARATEFRDHLKRGMDHVEEELAIAFKRRTPENEPSVIDMVGEVAGRPAIIYDDMIQSGGTLLQVVDLLLERGASEVHAAAVHADLTPVAVSALRASPLASLALSDTTAAAEAVAGAGIEIVTSARILAQAIWRIHTQQSVGWIFDTMRDEGELPPIDRHGR